MKHYLYQYVYEAAQAFQKHAGCRVSSRTTHCSLNVFPGASLRGFGRGLDIKDD